MIDSVADRASWKPWGVKMQRALLKCQDNFSDPRRA